MIIDWPVLRTETTVREYYDCGNPKHRHQTLEVAVRCLALQKKRASPKKPHNVWTSSAYRSLLMRRQAGETLKAIGITLGVTPEVIRQRVLKAERLIREGKLTLL